MESLLVFFLVAISGSTIGATWGKRFEELLPASILSVIILLYIFGIAGNLKLGVYFVLFMTLLIIGMALIRFFISSEKKKILTYFFSPGLFLFILLYLSLIVFNAGRLAYNWDEFSHWMTSVKVMSLLDDFIAVPESSWGFKSYPPGITLLQYFFQKVYELTGKQDFSEWRCFVAYQLCGLSLFFPALKRIKHLDILQLLLYSVGLVLLPLLFYPDFYNSIVVDPLIGLLAGSAFFILIFEKDHLLKFLYICIMCSTLVLFKDIGKLFAIFVAIGFFLSEVLSVSDLDKEQRKKNWYIQLVSPFVCAVGTVFSWKRLLEQYHTPIAFGNHIDFLQYSKNFFLVASDTTYKQNVIKNYKQAFWEARFHIGNNGLKISCCMLTIALFLMSFITIYRYYVVLTKKERSIWAIWGLMVSLIILYIYSLGAVYLSNFGEYEAVNLASYERYLGMPFLMIWTIIIWGTIYWIDGCFFDYKRCNLIIVFITFMLLLNPLEQIQEFVNGEARAHSLRYRSKYTDICDVIEKNCEKDDRIYFISQTDTGGDAMVCNFSLIPLHVGGYSSIGPPFYEGDIWSKKISVSEFKEELFRDYDYLAIFHLNQFFIDTYGELFEQRNEIAEGTLFKVDRKRMKLFIIPA